MLEIDLLKVVEMFCCTVELLIWSSREICFVMSYASLKLLSSLEG